MKKWILFLGAFLPFYVNAQMPSGGSCGENCQYTIVQNNAGSGEPSTYTLTLSAIDNTKPATVQEYIRSHDDERGFYTNAPWCSSSVTEVNITEGIQSIGPHAFENMGDTLRTLTLPEGLLSIGGEAFHGFNATSVTFPSTLETIGGFAFDSSLESINGLPDGLKYIGDYAFANSQLKEIVIPESVTFVSPYAFGDSNWRHAKIENVYCSAAQKSQCEEMVAFRGDSTTVTTYQFDDGVYQIDDRFYTSAENMQKDILRQENDTTDYTCGTDLGLCKAAVLKNKKLCSELSSDCSALVSRANEGKLLKIGSKTYQSLDALLKGNYDKRRIYTIEEANFVAGPVNRVSIKYR